MKFFQVTKPQLIMLITLIISTIAVDAQNKKIIFSNNGEQAEINGNASINISSGDITVQTVDPKIIVDGQTTTVLGFYPDTYSITPPGSVVVNWASAFSNGCNAM